MSNEHHTDPEVLQELDSVFEELRREEAVLLHLPSENERLRARLERLQQGRGRFRKALRHGYFGDEAFLPETLEPPFSVQPSLSPERRRRDVLALLVLGAVALALQWQYVGSGTPWLFALLTLISGVRLSRAWHTRSWFFSEDGIEVWDTWKHQKPVAFIRYSQLVDAEARVTPSQSRRGVGTVVVRYRSNVGGAELSMKLQDSPDPERLVKWLRTLRGSLPTADGS